MSSSVTDIFTNWFRGLTPAQQQEVMNYIYSGRGSTALKGYYVGPAPSQSSTCPMCGKPF